jgi:hypothetical protein
MARKRRSDEDLVAISEHLLYEIDLLYKTARVLATFGHAQDSKAIIIRNALLESFAIHTRNLIDFFYQDKPNSDQVIAQDFFDNGDLWVQQRPTKSQFLKKTSIRVHKEVAHLSYDRLKVTSEKKEWKWINIAAEIGKVLKKFHELVPDSRVSNDFDKISFQPVDEVLASSF